MHGFKGSSVCLSNFKVFHRHGDVIQFMFDPNQYTLVVVKPLTMFVEAFVDVVEATIMLVELCVLSVYEAIDFVVKLTDLSLDSLV